MKRASFRESGNEGCGICDDDGGIAQLGEHLPCKQGVSGSIPLISTKIRLKHFAKKRSVSI